MSKHFILSESTPHDLNKRKMSVMLHGKSQKNRDGLLLVIFKCNHVLECVQTAVRDRDGRWKSKVELNLTP